MQTIRHNHGIQGRQFPLWHVQPKFHKLWTSRPGARKCRVNAPWAPGMVGWKMKHEHVCGWPVHGSWTTWNDFHPCSLVKIGRHAWPVSYVTGNFKRDGSPNKNKLCFRTGKDRSDTHAIKAVHRNLHPWSCTQHHLKRNHSIHQNHQNRWVQHGLAPSSQTALGEMGRIACNDAEWYGCLSWTCSTPASEFPGVSCSWGPSHHKGHPA